jgi:hypothetical protein
MPKVDLQGAGIVPSVGKGIAAGVPEHARLRLEGQLGHFSSSFDHPGETGGRERRASLRGEHEWRLRLVFALEPAPPSIEHTIGDGGDESGAGLGWRRRQWIKTAISPA